MNRGEIDSNYVCFVEQTKAINECESLIMVDFNDLHIANLFWLNKLCAAFLEFTKLFQQFLNKGNSVEFNAEVETIHLCLAQVVTCIRHMEHIIGLEQNNMAKPLLFARQHFKDRLLCCLNRLCNSMNGLHSNLRDDYYKRSVLENNYVDTLELLLIQLTPFTDDDNDETNDLRSTVAVAMCEKIKISVDIILSYTLSFANVALNKDKMALSALCQKVMREFQAFACECKLHCEKGSINYSDRKLKARALENASIQMENFVNEALLRLIFTCFLDYERISIEHLRQEIHESLAVGDETNLDLLIADFDINMDRTAQIGIFAVCSAPDNKLKTIVRSCLASFESLEVALIAALRFKNTPKDADILERHYNEEVEQLKAAILQIVDIQAFASCYYELLTQCVAQLDAIAFDKNALEDILKMGAFVEKLFELPCNKIELQTEANCLKYFEDFCKMLRECRAILKCFAQVEQRRIIKRFKILQAVLRKFLEALGAQSYIVTKSEISTAELSDVSTTSPNNIIMHHNLQSNISKNLSFYRNDNGQALENICQSLLPRGANVKSLLMRPAADTSEKIRHNARRKESLRRFLFRRQRNLDAHNGILATSMQDSSGILKELNDLSMNLANAFKETKDWLNETTLTTTGLHISEDIIETI